MKILHVATGFQLSYPGGITNYVRSLVKSQIALGDQVHVLARPENCTPADSIVKPYIPFKVVPFSLRTVDSDVCDSALWNEINRERYDLVHFHMALDFPMRTLRTFAGSALPYIVSLHDYYYICPRIYMVDSANEVCRRIDVSKCCRCIGAFDQVDLLRKASRKLKFQLPRVSSKAAELRLREMETFLGNARVLLPVSNRTAEIYREVVPRGQFIVEQIGNESADHEPITKVSSERIRLVFIGTLSRIKGGTVLEKLLTLVRRRDLEFHFYGRTWEGFDKRLRPLGLMFHGSYQQEDLPGIMANADVGLVLPIWEDNGPQVAMEFVNHRVPVVGTRRGGIPDTVLSENGILFDPDSDAEIDRVVHWLENVSIQDLETISAGMKRLKTPAQHADRIREIYNLVLERPADQSGL